MMKRLCLIGFTYLLVVQSLFAEWTSDISEIEKRYNELKEKSEFAVEKNIFLEEEIKEHIKTSMDKLERSYDVWMKVWKKQGLLKPFVKEIERHQDLMNQIKTNWRYQGRVRV